VAGYIRSYIKF